MNEETKQELSRFLLVVAVLLTILISAIGLLRALRTKPKPSFTMGPGWVCLEAHNELVPDPDSFAMYNDIPVAGFKQVSVCDQWHKLP